MDYPAEKLKGCSMFGTENLKYVPFDEATQALCLKHWQNQYKEEVLSGKMAAYENKKNKNKQNEMAAFEITTDQLCQGFVDSLGWCQYRSLYIASRDKTNRIKVVFGGLGFVQEDGSVYYRWGG